MTEEILTDISDAVLDCASPKKITRALSSAVVEGRAQKPTTFTFIAQLSVQPMSGAEAQRELQRLPEGQRTNGMVKAYGITELKTVDTSECRVPDRFKHGGIEYQISGVDNWHELGGYFKYTATQVGR